MSAFLSEKHNFLALHEEYSDPETAQVVIMSVPFETTSTYGHGSAHGPHAMIRASHQVELFDADLGFEPYKSARGIATLPTTDIAGYQGESLAQRLARECAFWLERDKFVLTLGGEHTSVVGAVNAHCEVYDDVTVLQLDAHSDLRPSYLGDPWNHACTMARVLDKHDSLAQVGIRSQSIEEREIAEARRIPVFTADEIHDAGQDWLQTVTEPLRPRVYITFDCDVMDPSVMPATGTPDPGGLTYRQVCSLFEHICREREVIGLDITELAPIPGLRHPEFTMAKLIYRFLGYRFGSKQR